MSSQSTHTIEINRAPVLTLWATIVAEWLGHDHETALTLGKAVAGLNAQAKGRRLGIFKPTPSEKRLPKRKRGEEFWVEVCGRPVPAKQTDEGVRAVVGDKPISPESVQSYLGRSFGDNLAKVQAAMESLARSHKPEELENQSYGLYEQFRPNIPSGVKSQPCWKKLTGRASRLGRDAA
jgi:hypothetical protein